jgi:hypothetical protein
MALDPLTALSLAGTVVQLVDFTSKIFSTSYELHRSTTRALAENEGIELVTSDLLALSTKLHVSLYSSEASGCFSQEEQRLADNLKRICDEAATVAEKIIQKLDRLKVKGKHRVWESFQQAVRAAWSKTEIANLLERLSNLRMALDTHVLLSLRYFYALFTLTNMTYGSSLANFP